jgi:type IV pilus assembly protein PilC
MARYIYTARDDRGKILKGILIAAEKRIVRTKLREMGYYVTKITEEKKMWLLSRIAQIVKPVSIDDLVTFCQQFSSLIGSGVPTLSCLKVLWKQTENKKLQLIISKIHNDLSSGLMLSQALARHPRVFSNFFVNLIKVGEAGGMLDFVFKKLVTHLHKEQELHQKIKTAFVYPSVVIILGAAVVVFLMLVVIPVFAAIFARVGMSLPFITRVLITISSLIRSFWWLGIVIFVAVVYAWNHVKKFRPGQEAIDHFKLKVPFFGKLSRQVAMARFVRTFGILADAALPLSRTFDIVGHTADNCEIKKAIMEARRYIRTGDSISAALEKARLFSPMVVQMIAIGEESGTLNQMLEKSADYLEQDIDYKIKRLTTLLEPTLTVGLGLIVGFIAVSIYQPIFDMTKVFGR